MKRLKMLLLLVAVFAVLMAGYYAIGRMNESESVTETAGSFELHPWTEETLAGLAWTNEHGSFDFRRQDGVWVKADDAAFPVNQTALDNLAGKIIDMTGTREIADVTEPGDYGLAEPAFRVTIAGSDGAQITYAMGDETPFADGYYLSVSGKDEIYTVESSLSSLFAKTLTQLCEMEEIPETGNVTALTVSGALNAVYDEGAGLWRDTVSGETLDAEGVQALIDAAKGIVWHEVVMAGADGAALQGYGLDDAQATLIRMEGGEDAAFEILLGSTGEDGSRYARLPGSSMVYAVEGTDTDALLGASVDGLWNRSPVMTAYDALGMAQLSWEGGSMQFAGGAQEAAASEEETEEEASGEAATGEEASAAQEDDADAETDEERLWARITSLTGTQRVESMPQGSALLTISYTDAQGTVYAAEIYAYDVDSYLLPISDGAAMLVPADEVDAIIRMLKTM